MWSSSPNPRHREAAVSLWLRQENTIKGWEHKAHQFHKRASQPANMRTLIIVHRGPEYRADFDDIAARVRAIDTSIQPYVLSAHDRRPLPTAAWEHPDTYRLAHIDISAEAQARNGQKELSGRQAGASIDISRTWYSRSAAASVQVRHEARSCSVRRVRDPEADEPSSDLERSRDPPAPTAQLGDDDCSRIFRRII